VEVEIIQLKIISHKNFIIALLIVQKIVHIKLKMRMNKTKNVLNFAQHHSMMKKVKLVKILVMNQDHIILIILKNV